MSDRKQQIKQMEARILAALEQARRRGRRDHDDLLDLLKQPCLLDSLNNDRGFVHSERSIARRLAEMAADNPGFATGVLSLLNPPKHKPRLIVSDTAEKAN